MDYLFVHGTFRRGGKDNGQIAAGTFLGLAETAQQYALCVINEKPLITKRPVSAIKGEVYSATEDLLKLVDRLAGHPRVNRRELVSVQLEDGQTVDAWLYFYLQPLHNAVLIESGDFFGPKC